MAGKIYIVATPIGNLSDITLRGLEVLKEVNTVLAEDTRVSQKLLDHYQIKTRIIRYDQHSFRNDAKKLEVLNLLMQGLDVALITDAGTPGISDPGNELIDWLYSVSSEVEIVPVPGPSSVTAALSVCGFDVSSYLFVGFLPKKKKNKLYDQIKNISVPLVFFESPFRIVKTLEEMGELFGDDKRIFIGRELTKVHEEKLRGSVETVLSELKNRDAVKGEIVGILEKIS